MGKAKWGPSQTRGLIIHLVSKLGDLQKEGVDNAEQATRDWLYWAYGPNNGGVSLNDAAIDLVFNCVLEAAGKQETPDELVDLTRALEANRLRQLEEIKWQQ